MLGIADEWFLAWQLNKPNAKSFSEILTAGTTPNGIFCAKVMPSHLVAMEERLSATEPPKANGKALPHVMAAFSDAVWVHIKRHNAVRQAVSNIIAQQRQIYHVVRSNTGFVPGSAAMADSLGAVLSDIDFEFASIMREAATIFRDNLFWSGFFERNEITPISLIYEDIEQMPAHEYLAPIADEFGIGRLPLAPPRNLQKMSGVANDTMYDAFFDELFRVLR